MDGQWRRISAWIGAVALTFTLCFSAYRSGLFFDEDFYRLETALIACAALTGVAGCFRVLRLRTPIWSYAPFAIAAAYALHLASHPASIKSTTDDFLRWTAYGSWTVLLGAYLADSRRRKAGWIALQLTGAFVAVGGWCGWFGWIRYPDIVFLSDQAELAATGARLAGFLQYPNAFGAVMAAFALVQWQLLASGSRAVAFAASLLFVPYTAALFLTESRGAWLALAFGAALSFVFRKKDKRGYGLAAAGVAIALSAAAARASFAAMERGHPADGLWMLLAGTAVGGLLVYALGDRDRLPFGGRANAVAARAAAAATSLPGGALVLLIGLLAAYELLAGGSSGGARIDGHFETAAARQLYYADALRMFRDHPWFGTGGQSWRMLVGLYQSKPYIGNEVHSGYLDMLLDTGLLGLALLLAMLAGFAVQLWKQAGRAWGPAAVLLAHSAIDFDWSYGFVWLLLFYWLALHLAAGEPPSGAGEAPAPPPRPRPSGFARPRPALAAPLGAALLLGFAAAALPAAWRSAAAASERDAALASAANAARASHLRAALRANPAWNRIRLELAPLLPVRERESLLLTGLRYEPHSPSLEYQLGMTYAELGNPAAARDRLREALRLARFDREAQNAAISRMATLADSFANAGRADESRIAAEAAAEFYERYRELYRRTYEGRDNPWYDRDKALFTAAKVNAAGAMMLLGRTEEAAAVLREAAQENAPDWKERAERLLRQLERGND